ncbi:MAG: hypothetical protein Q9203_001561 [Teloschistes exilis]
MTLPLVVASDNITTALAQSDLITQGDLAISGLSDAVAAGLIAEFPSPPNLTAAAAAQSLEWAPVTLRSLSISSVGISQDDSSATALLNLTLSAELGVSGSIADVAVAGSASHRRSLLTTDGSLAINSSVTSAALNTAVGSNVTAIDSSSGGAVLLDFSRMTEAVDDNTVVLSGLLANLSCIEAQMYELEKAMSVRENPLWVTPHATTAEHYTDLLEDFRDYSQSLEFQLKVIYSDFYLSFVQAASKIAGSFEALTDKGSSSSSSTAAVLSTEPGCARGSTGYARLEFVIDRDNITKEGVDVGAGRKLLHTPCSASDGTSLALNYTPVAAVTASNMSSSPNVTTSTASMYDMQSLPRYVGFSGNQLMGGVLLHSTRNTVTKSCGKFGKLVTKCTYNHTLYDAATGKAVLLPTTQGGLLPYGVDTFFLASSSTYDEHFTGTSEVAPYTGTPYGFFFTPLPDFDSGFPVIFDNRLLAKDCARLLSVLSEGNYLDDETAAVTARLLTFNDELQVYG